MGIREDKTIVRAEMRGFRISESECMEASMAIRDTLTPLTCWKTADTVLLFAPLPDEPDTFILPRGSKRFCYPRYHADRGYEAVEARNPDELLPGKFGVLEPPTEAPGVSAHEVDLVLVPGMAFDKECYRLGRGRGFYDRWLLALSGLKLGLGFDHQLIDRVPRETHDVKLDGVITPSYSVEVSCD
jgi:5-formyltetrahydrofolate cyclo-ligase